MKDASMFEDPDLPDFDSMSQEELIEWLEKLASIHAAATSEFIDDYNGDPAAQDTEDLTDDDEWSGWQDDAAPEGFVADDGLEPAAVDPPADLNHFHDEDTAPTASLDWLDEIIAAQHAKELPDFNNISAEAQSAAAAQELPDGEADDNPLDWLRELDSNGGVAPDSSPPANTLEYPEDFDETWEDDESLDDLEDESLYSLSADASASFLASLPSLEDREAEQHSTQSMAPVPDSQADHPPKTEHQPASAAADHADSLSRAFLVHENQADLEAWYAERLRAITSAAVAAAPKPAPIKPGKPPPPGLAAAINSARGKIEAEQLSDALLDYETLLGTTAGLQWVVHDMRNLIAQATYRDVPSVHRVLGDALMRQGHLNAALNVYRHALSLL